MKNRPVATEEIIEETTEEATEEAAAEIEEINILSN